MSGSRLPSENIFQVLPSGFFNLLAGGSNQEIYSECLLLIYDQFEREISYRVERRQIREVLSSFLYDQQIIVTRCVTIRGSMMEMPVIACGQASRQ